MKKQTNILQDYWEAKLGIDYDVEFEYYKKLCGMKYKHKKFLCVTVDIFKLSCSHQMNG